MRLLKTTAIIFLLPALSVLTFCNTNAQQTLHNKKMSDWRNASSEAKLNTCMDFIRIWKERQGEHIDAKTQKEDAIKLVNCLDQGIKELPRNTIDTMTVAQCGVSCCQYVIYGSIK